MSKFWSYFPEIDSRYRVNIEQGDTPLIKSEELKIVYKDEYHNKNHSFKDRGLSYQISRHLQEGKKNFALSTSGNAGITASYIASEYKINLDLFISSSIHKEKLQLLKEFSGNNNNIEIHISRKPRSDLFKFLRNNEDIVDLRGSTDPYAIEGYKTIAYEVLNQYPEVDAIFIPCSSGTSTIGIYEGFKQSGKNVSINICQTEKINPIARLYDTNFSFSETSLADAITDKLAIRRKSINDAISSTRGNAWVISDKSLLEAKSYVKGLNLNYLTYNSLLSLAGLLKSREKGDNYFYPVLLFSGL